MHESHDDPCFERLSPEDREFVAQIFKGLDARVKALEDARATSEPPDGTTEVRTAGGNRVRAPWWVAVTLAVLILAIAAVWRVETLAKLILVK